MKDLLNWALVFLIASLIAAVFGFTGLTGGLDWCFQIGFVVGLVLFLVTALTAAVRNPPLA